MEINLPSGNYLFIQCPSDIKKYWIHFDGISGQTKVANDSKNGWTVWQYVLEDKLAIEKYEIISTTKHITEEQAGSVVFHHVVSGTKYYSNYLPFKGQDFRDVIDNSFKTAKESLQSLLKANGLNEPNYLILKKL